MVSVHRAFATLFVDGNPMVLNIPYDYRIIGERITKQVISLRQIIINTIWKKIAFEEKNIVSLSLVLVFNDEKKEYKIAIQTNGRNAVEIEKDLLYQVAETTKNIMYRLSYLVLTSKDYILQ